jgi:AcrR family transcriptional regulator
VTQTDGRLLRGEHTRRMILDRAMQIASVDGLEGLSIGRLATELEVSKSGVFTHFGSKEELQLATVRAAAEIFVTHVIHPADEVPPGLGRVWRLCTARLEYLRRPPFLGGCFFYAAAAEFDAKPGRVRDAVADGLRRWRKRHAHDIAEAITLGEIEEGTDPDQLAFELDSLIRGGGADALLFDDPTFIDRTRTALLTRLQAAATPHATPALDSP